MEAHVTCISRPLKPEKQKKKRPQQDASNKLKLWKKVGRLRYRSHDEGASTAAGSMSTPLSLVAFCRKSRQARLYSLHESSTGSVTSTSDKAVKVKRKKTKLPNVSIMSMSLSGRYVAVAAGSSDLLIRVFDLSSAEHQCTAQVPFPECMAVRVKHRKDLRVPAPHFMHISDDGQTLISQSKDQGNWASEGHIRLLAQLLCFKKESNPTCANEQTPIFFCIMPISFFFNKQGRCGCTAITVATPEGSRSGRFCCRAVRWQLVPPLDL